jgi:mannobiose 2-epimerase
MWDREHGGFFWQVNASDGQASETHKHVYGQAFALYALSEYFLAFGDRTALDLANTLVDLLESRAYDPEFGGYREFFSRDWSQVPDDAAPYISGARRDVKTMNTHLHLMEAFTTYLRATDRPLARKRLEELIAIQSNRVVRKELPACTDRYRRDWTPLLDDESARVSFGHDIENIWLLADAMDAMGRPNAMLLDLYRGLFAYSMKNGYDREKGGFFDSAPLGRPADRLGKIWWVQAEALVSALTMYRLTRESTYAQVFDQTWRFVNETQTDWQHGDWHAIVLPDGSHRGRKAEPWKAAYHNGRALLESIRIIEQLQGD